MPEIVGTNGLPTVPLLERDEVGISGLKAEDFLNMLITQLKYQDPTEPTDNEQILTQVSQLRDLQASTDLSDSLQQMVSGSELSNAAGLIGQRIVGTNTDGERVQGIASSARLVDGDAVLRVNGTDVRVTSIQSVAAGDSVPVDTNDSSAVAESDESPFQEPQIFSPEDTEDTQPAFIPGAEDDE